MHASTTSTPVRTRLKFVGVTAAAGAAARRRAHRLAGGCGGR